MNKIQKTLEDLDFADFILTRYIGSSSRDLDILVKPMDFSKVSETLHEKGYLIKSHEMALGGRLKNMQLNLIKKGRTKIDLHKDFTWRKQRYLDLKLIWDKKDLADQFLVFINIIFEKTYIEKAEYEYIWEYKNEIFSNNDFRQQAKKYDWDKTFINFKNWNPEKFSFPFFVPVWIVLFSYFEKFDLISLLYYIFFRIRYVINKTLPYD